MNYGIGINAIWYFLGVISGFIGCIILAIAVNKKGK